jgi:AAA domain
VWPSAAQIMACVLDRLPECKMPIQFKKAIKYDARGRVAIVGPAGSGKSFTSLKLATLLAGDGGKIAAIDTEHGSLSKYADLFDFDVFEMESYSPTNFIDALDEAERQNYSVLIVDSLSHFWTGKDGALEFVDMAAKRHKDNMGGWKDFRPHERLMVDRMIASPCHIIVTMRTKTEYKDEEYTSPRGERKTKRVKVGLQPVQREGLEYEFDLVAYMDEENNFIVEKTRCPHYAKKAFTQPAAEDFFSFRDWLKGTIREQGAVAPASESEKAGSQNGGTDLSALTGKIKAAKEQFAKTFGDGGRTAYLGILGANGAETEEDIASPEQAAVVLNELTSTFKAMRKEATAAA